MTQPSITTRYSRWLDYIWVVVPAFNEQEAIGEVVAQLLATYRNVVVIDDGSTDCTTEVALRSGAIVCRHPINLGQGAALQTGVSYALSHAAQVIVTFDADGQHQVSDIASMVRALDEADASVALGSRFIGGTINMPPLRRMLLRAAVVFTRLTTWLEVTDVHNGLRAFRADAARHISISQNGMAHASEILEQIAHSKLRYAEVPVTITYTEYSKRKGQTTANMINILVDLLTQEDRQMIIQFVLTAGLSIFLIYGVVQQKRFGLISILLYAMSASGIYFVWQPNHANYLAKALGVGRGADLIFYFWIIISLIVGLNLHLKLKKTMNLVTQLARHTALQSAMVPDSCKPSSDKCFPTNDTAAAPSMSALSDPLRNAAEFKKHPTC